MITAPNFQSLALKALKCATTPWKKITRDTLLLLKTVSVCETPIEWQLDNGLDTILVILFDTFPNCPKNKWSTFYACLPGLLHSLNSSEVGDPKFSAQEIQTLLVRCSTDPHVAVRSEAAMELIELISGSREKEANEDDVENEDFNDNNIK